MRFVKSEGIVVKYYSRVYFNLEELQTNMDQSIGLGGKIVQCIMFCWRNGPIHLQYSAGPKAEIGDRMRCICSAGQAAGYAQKLYFGRPSAFFRLGNMRPAL